MKKKFTNQLSQCTIYSIVVCYSEALYDYEVYLLSDFIANYHLLLYKNNDDESILVE